jgi:hypothetical protein
MRLFIVSLKYSMEISKNINRGEKFHSLSDIHTLIKGGSKCHLDNDIIIYEKFKRISSLSQFSTTRDMSCCLDEGSEKLVFHFCDTP